MNAEKYTEPYLCGGVLLTILIRFVNKSTTANDHLENMTEPKSNTSLFKSLVGVYQRGEANLKQESLDTETSNFKNCKENAEEYAGFNNREFRLDFDNDVKGNNTIVMKRMENTVRYFLTLGTPEQQIRLVKILMKLVSEDKNISDNQQLYIFGDGRQIDKATLKEQTDINIDAFLLGLWHYCVMFRCDKNNNDKARNTINALKKASYIEWLEEYPLPKSMRIYLYKSESASTGNNGDNPHNADDGSDSSDEPKKAVTPTVVQHVEQQIIQNAPVFKIGTIQNFYTNGSKNDEQ